MKTKTQISPNIKKAKAIVWGLQRYFPVQPFQLMQGADINRNQASRILSLKGRYFGPSGLGEEKYIKKITSILNRG